MRLERRGTSFPAGIGGLSDAEFFGKLNLRQSHLLAGRKQAFPKIANDEILQDVRQACQQCMQRASAPTEDSLERSLAV